MLGFGGLGVAISLIMVFLVFSLIMTATRELIEAFLKTRSRDLSDFVQQALAKENGGKATDEAMAAFFNHPMIYALYSGSFDPGQVGTKRSKLPSYIPSASFASAVIDLAKLEAIDETQPIGRAIATIRRDVGDDAARLRSGLSAWYDASMERLAGAYKRRSQKLIFGLGFLLALVLNLNTIVIVDDLANNPAKTAALVAFAEHVAKQGTMPDANTGLQEIDALGVPFGWGPESPITTDGTKVSDLLAGKVGAPAILSALAGCVIGWLIMAIAGTLGAPFWFDLLGKFVNVRSTLKSTDDMAPKAPEAPGKPNG